MKEKDNRSKWLHIRLTAAELVQIKTELSRSTCRALSELARKKLLGKAVTVNYRNQSVDTVTEQLAELKAELHAAGHNFNQAVKKLHVLSAIKDFEQWLISYELDRRRLLAQVEKVGESIHKISEKW